MLARKIKMFLICTLLCPLFLVGCGNKYSNFTDIYENIKLEKCDMIKIMNQGDEIEVKDEDSIQQFAKLIVQLEIKKYKPEEDATGSQYILKFYEGDEKYLTLVTYDTGLVISINNQKYYVENSENIDDLIAIVGQMYE